MSNKFYSLIAMSLLSLEGIGPAKIKKVSSITALTIDPIEALIQYASLLKRQISSQQSKELIEDACNALFISDKANVSYVSIFDREYPLLLRELSDPPSVLYYRGSLPINQVVSIIGTRQSTKKGEKSAQKISEFVSNLYAVCNGLSEGIDKKVYLSLEQGNTLSKMVAVVASGLDFEANYLRTRDTSLQCLKIIENNGCVISEYPPSTLEDTYKVIDSCRIQSGISMGCILIQSGLGGGSRFAVATTMKLGRMLGIVNPFQDEQGMPSWKVNELCLSDLDNALESFIAVSPAKKKVNLVNKEMIKILHNKVDVERFLCAAQERVSKIKLTE